MIQEITIEIKNVGKMKQLTRSEKGGFILLPLIYDDFNMKYPLFRVGDYVISFPTMTAMAAMKLCDWAVITDTLSGTLLGFFPDLDDRVTHRLYRKSLSSDFGKTYIISDITHKVYVNEFPEFFSELFQFEKMWLPVINASDID